MKENPSNDFKQKVGEHGLAATKVILSLFPLGSSVAEILSMILTPSLTKRRDKWIEGIAKDLERLQEQVQGFSIKKLCENETFVTTLLQATQAAIRAHQKEKLDALRNAVLNSSLPQAPDDNLQQIFLNIVDITTPSHIKMLKEIEGKWYGGVSYSRDSHEPSQAPSVLLYLFSSSSEDEPDVAGKVFKDLENSGLIINHFISYEEVMRQTYYDAIITNLGLQFLRFITSPLDDSREDR